MRQATASCESAANGTVVGVTALATDGDATDTITYSLDDDAGGRFAINASTGVVTVANNTLLDYETTTSHNITVRATSSDTSTNTAGFTINLTDDNTEFSISAVSDSNAAGNSVSESAANGTVVGVTALATDGDVTDTITYSLDDDAGGRFAINASSGVVTVANNTLLDYETTTSHNITVRATSSDTSAPTRPDSRSTSPTTTPNSRSVPSATATRLGQRGRRIRRQRHGSGRNGSGHRWRCHRYDHLLAG